MTALSSVIRPGDHSVVAAAVDAAVVGGGIGGLATALALSRAGVSVRVLEQAPEFGEVGAGLQLAPNASRHLRDWGLLDEVMEHGVLPTRITMLDAVDGATLTSLDLAEVARRYGAPYVVIHRSDLHAILVEACRRAGVDLVTNAAVTDVLIEDAGATVMCAARRDTAEIVVGADGLQSKLRGRINDDEPVGSNYVAYRGTVPVADAVGRRVPLDEVVLYVGPGCHFIHYPLRGGDMLNQVAVFQSPGALRGDDDWGGPDELDEAFADTCADVRNGLASLWRDRSWQMYDRAPVAKWVDRRLVLTGDAAHPMLQYLAQDACQAVEDAAALADCVRAARTPRGIDWDDALRAFNDARAERSGRVQTSARFWGDFWHCDGMARTVRNAYLRERDVDDYRYVDWLYGA